jgi:hypothetical protein
LVFEINVSATAVHVGCCLPEVTDQDLAQLLTLFLHGRGVMKETAPAPAAAEITRQRQGIQPRVEAPTRACHSQRRSRPTAASMAAR